MVTMSEATCLFWKATLVHSTMVCDLYSACLRSPKLQGSLQLEHDAKLLRDGTAFYSIDWQQTVCINLHPSISEAQLSCLATHKNCVTSTPSSALFMLMIRLVAMWAATSSRRSIARPCLAKLGLAATSQTYTPDCCLTTEYMAAATSFALASLKAWSLISPICSCWPVRHLGAVISCGRIFSYCSHSLAICSGRCTSEATLEMQMSLKMNFPFSVRG